MTELLAHASHWTSALIYLGPLILVAVYQGVAAVRGRRRRGRGERT
jgi:hypothetical protein